MRVLAVNGTPTFNGDSTCTFDSTDLLSAPTSLVSATQGWAAARVRPSWASGTPTGTNPRIVEFGGFDVYYDTVTLKWRLDYGANNVQIANAHAAGDSLTVVAAWDATTLKLSINGAPFVSVARGADQNVTDFSIGNRAAGQDRALNGDFYWYAGGSGTPADADAATLNAFGNTDPDWFALPSSAYFLWTANDRTYLDVKSANPSAAVDFSRALAVPPGRYGMPGPSGAGGFERVLASRFHAIIPANINVSLRLLSETDALLAAAGTKDAALSLLSDTSSLLSAVATRQVPLNLLSEVDALLSAVSTKSANLGLLSEADTILAVTGSKNVTMGLLSSTLSLLSMSATRQVSLGLLAEADAFLAATGTKDAALGLLSSSPSLLSMTATRQVTIGQLLETDALLAAAGTKSALLGMLSEADVLLALSSGIVRNLGILIETDALQGMQVAQARSILLGILSEADQLLLIRPPRGLYLDPVGPNTLVLLEAVKLFP